MSTRTSRSKATTAVKTTKSASTTAHRKKISASSASESTADENIENIPIMNIRPSTRRTKAATDQTATTPSTQTTRRRQRQISESESDSECLAPLDVTPPKIRKPTKPSKDLRTPTKLLNRMSIDERPKADESDDDNEASPLQTALQSAKKSLNNGRIQNLPGREKELAKLTEFFTESLATKTAASMYICGPPGTGKTACLSKLLKTKQFANKFKTVYLNCTGIASIAGIYKQICSEFGLRPSTEKENLQKIRKYLTNCPKMILMVLDEVDQLVGQKQSVLYTIFEWPALADSKLLLIGIANSLDLTDRMLSRLNAKCELRPKLMHFAPYTKQQIVDIFKSRLDEAGMQTVFPAVTVQLLAAKVAAVSGDVRRALDIGRRVIEMAEMNRDLDLNELGVADLEATGKPVDKVELKQVMSVLNDVYGGSQNLMAEIEDAYPLQQKVLICSLLLLMKRSKNKDITMGRLHGVFTRICAKRHIDAVGQAEFISMCVLVETRGIISVVAKKEPRLSKVQLQWDEEEVTAALQDKQLIASILADTTISIQ